MNSSSLVFYCVDISHVVYAWSHPPLSVPGCVFAPQPCYMDVQCCNGCHCHHFIIQVTNDKYKGRTSNLFYGSGALVCGYLVLVMFLWSNHGMVLLSSQEMKQGTAVGLVVLALLQVLGWRRWFTTDKVERAMARKRNEKELS